MNKSGIITILTAVLLLSSFFKGVCRAQTFNRGTTIVSSTPDYTFYYTFDDVSESKKQINLKEIHPNNDVKKENVTFDFPESFTFEGVTYDVVKIGADYFDEQESLFRGWLRESVVRVRLPKKLIMIGHDSFRNCENLREIIWSDSIVQICSRTFSGCTSLKAIHIPESVVTIESGVFYNCTNLQYVHLPEGITKIKDDLFHSCTSLTSISLPSGITDIPPETFKDCKSLKEIRLPTELKLINSQAFMGCENLRHIDLPDSLKSIWHYAFASTSLQSIILPTSVNTFSPLAIIDTPITELHLPAHIIDLGNKHTSLRSLPNIERITVDPANPNYDSREDCNAIIEKESNILLCACKNSTIPEGVREISYHAFEGLGVSSITIPYGVRRIRVAAFKDNNLTELELPPTVEGIDGSAFMNNKLRKLEIPSSVTYIGSAFSDNEIEELTLNEGLKSIYSSFMNNPLKKVTIPSTVNEIAPFGNGDYTEIRCKARTPPLGYTDYRISWQPVITQCFDFNIIKCPVYVPKGCGEAYANSKYWQGANLIEYVTEGIDDTITDLQENGSAPIYDLSGRKVSNSPQRGIYIKNGKKYFVR